MTISDRVKRPTVASVLRRYRCSLRRHSAVTAVAVAAVEPPPNQARRIVGLLSYCRQGPLGCHAYHCEQCSERHVRMNSCGNRHCPTCGCRRRWEWRERVIGWSLDCDYLHVVFTLPHELNDLMRANQAELYRLLFRCSIDTLSRVAGGEYGCRIGMVATLHTWGQRLNQHVHVHVVMTAGGRFLDGSRWVPITADDPAMDRRKLAEGFEKTYLKRLKTLFKKGRLEYPERDFHELVERIERKRWIVDVQATPPKYQGAEAIINYLAAYVSGAAISDGRMLSDDGQRVTFRIKDYKTGKAAEQVLTGEQFVDRFSMHILPHRLQRLRYAGMFQSRGREERLGECRRLIEEAGLVRKRADEEAVVEAVDKDRPQDAEEAPPEKVEQRCKCGAEMRRLGRLGGEVTMRLIGRVTMLTAALAAGADERVLKRLRDELVPPSSGRQPLVDATAPTPRQLESFIVLTLVERRLAAEREVSSPAAAEAEEHGIPPPVEKAVA